MSDLLWTRLRLAFAVIAISSLVIGAASAAADDGAQPPSEKKVTLQLANTPVIDAIEMLFRDTGYKYTVLPGVSGRINLRLADVPFEQALAKLTDLAGLEYQVKAGRYIIGPKPKKEAEVTATPKEVPEEQSPHEGVLPPGHPPIEPAYPNGPIFYGHRFFRHRHPAVPFFRSPTITVLPDGSLLVGKGLYGAPLPLPPPSLRTPSIQRFIDQMNAIEPYMHPTIQSYLPTLCYSCYPWSW